MKTINFEIRLPEHGKTVGTLGWIAEKLENAEVKISGTKSGAIGVFVSFSDTAICFCNHEPYKQGGGWFVRDIGGGRYIHTRPTVGTMDDGPLFDFLTPAAEKKADEFIVSCVEALKEYIENN